MQLTDRSCSLAGILGQVEAFETEFAAYCKTQYCVGVGNGLEALHLILRAMEIGRGMKLCQLIPISPPGWQFLMQELSRSG